MRLISLLGLALAGHAHVLQRGVRPPRPCGSSARSPSTRVAAVVSSSTDGLEDELLELCERGGSKRSTLAAFERLERAAPPPADLLLSDAGARALDGRWDLVATVAASVGDADLESSGVSNAVNASGLVLDTAGGAVPVQEVSVATSRIGNELSFALPGLDGLVRVAGRFEADRGNARRALVEFDALDVFVSVGRPTRYRRLLRAGLLFGLIRAVRPALANGDDGESWLETTYLSPRVRLGRGNKGSVFVLRRAADNGRPPLDEWAL